MKSRIRLTLVGVAALSLALAGCSNSATPAATPSSSASKATSVTAVTVGTSPTASNASLYYAESSGEFKKNNIASTPQVLQSGGAAVPLLLNGQIQFAASDPLSAIVAIGQGTPLKIVAVGAVAASKESEDPSAFVSGADSGIKTLADVNGKTVAVNQVGGLAQIGLRAAIDSNGGDSSSVKWVEVGFPQIVDAVKNNTVGGGATNEPFVTQARAQGLTIVPKGGLSTSLAGVPQVVYLTSVDYAKSHPEVVDGFAKSLVASNTALGKDPEMVRTVAATSTTVPPAVLAKIILPIFGPKLSLDSLEKLQKYMVKYGAIKAPVKNLKNSMVAAGMK